MPVRPVLQELELLQDSKRRHEQNSSLCLEPVSLPGQSHQLHIIVWRDEAHKTILAGLCNSQSCTWT